MVWVRYLGSFFRSHSTGAVAGRECCVDSRTPRKQKFHMIVELVRKAAALAGFPPCFEFRTARAKTITAKSIDREETDYYTDQQKDKRKRVTKLVCRLLLLKKQKRPFQNTTTATGPHPTSYSTNNGRQISIPTRQSRCPRRLGPSSATRRQSDSSTKGTRTRKSTDNQRGGCCIYETQAFGEGNHTSQ